MSGDGQGKELWRESRFTVAAMRFGPNSEGTVVFEIIVPGLRPEPLRISEMLTDWDPQAALETACRRKLLGQIDELIACLSRARRLQNAEAYRFDGCPSARVSELRAESEKQGLVGFELQLDEDQPVAVIHVPVTLEGYVSHAIERGIEGLLHLLSDLREVAKLENQPFGEGRSFFKGWRDRDRPFPE